MLGGVLLGFPGPGFTKGAAIITSAEACGHADIVERVRRMRESGWRRLARCRDDDELDFYSDQRRNILACKATCAHCPVRLVCALEALRRRDPWGIWGGLTPDERDELAEPDPLVALALRVGTGAVGE